MINLYEILEIEILSDQQKIKKAFKKLALKYHPDKNPNNLDAQEKFLQINQAYQILSNTEQKEIYDRQLSHYIMALSSPNLDIEKNHTQQFEEKEEEKLNWKASIFAILTITYVFFLVNSMTNIYTAFNYHQAITAYRSGKKAEANKWITKAVAANPQYARAKYLQGLLSFETRYIEKSIQEFNEAIKLSESFHPEYYMARARAYQFFEDHKYADRALSDFRKVIGIIDTSQVYQQMIYSYMTLNQYDNAYHIYKYLNTNHEDIELLEKLARHSSKYKNFDKSLFFHTKIIEKKPNHLPSRIERAIIYLDQIKNVDKACEEWRYVKKINPQITHKTLDFFCQ